MWAASDTFEVRDGTVRIRSGSADTAAAVRAALSDRLREDRETSNTYSVRLERPANPQPFHVLYEGCLMVTRSRDPERVLRALVARVEGREALDRTDVAHLAGCAVVGPRGAAMLPPALTVDLVRIERRLNAMGLRVVDAPFVTFDSATGQLVVPETPTVAAEVLRGLDLYRGTEPGPAAPGRHRLRGWLLEGSRAAEDPHRLAISLVQDGPALGADRGARLVARLLESSRVIDRWYPWPDDLVSAVVRLAEGRR